MKPEQPAFPADAETESLPAKLYYLKHRSGVKNDNEFARLAGVARSSMSQYLKGRQVPRPAVLHRLAKATGVNVDWLLGMDAIMEAKEFPALPRPSILDAATLDAPVNYFLLSLSIRSCKEFFEREQRPKPTLRETLDWVSAPYSLHAGISDIDYVITPVKND